MKWLACGVLGAIAGGLLTAFLLLGVLTGVGAGAGLVTGLKAGICLATDVAKSKNYLTGPQAQELVAETIKKLGDRKLAEQAAVAAGEAECKKLIDEIQKSNDAKK
jgi:hypothetical protein